MTPSNYIPFLKTKASEMKAFRMLSPELKKRITPFVELTASRKSKKLPEGSIDKSMELLIESMGENGSFILDIASDEDLRNSELEDFYNAANGYEKWCSFVEGIENAKDRLRPVLLINLETGAPEDLSRQAIRLIDFFGEIFLRLPVADVNSQDIRDISSLLPTDKIDCVNLVLDVGFIGQNRTATIATEILDLVPAIRESGFQRVRIASSSFPKMVTTAGFGKNDTVDQFHIDELNLYDRLSREEPNLTWLYSDYGTVHPVRYSTKGGVWIPRIDVPLERTIFYYRYRREDGGYKRAAGVAYADKNVFDQVFDCWGKDQIKTAATGTPPGLSPALWISVRINIHLTRRGRALE